MEKISSKMYIKDYISLPTRAELYYVLYNLYKNSTAEAITVQDLKTRNFFGVKVDLYHQSNADPDLYNLKSFYFNYAGELLKTTSPVLYRKNSDRSNEF